MKQETKAYQNALSIWKDFHARTRGPDLDREMPDRRVAFETFQERILRAVPPVEREPSAVGMFIRSARKWSMDRKKRFLGEFLESPSPGVWDLLEAVSKAETVRPPRLPVTLEEFPSRIWQRALASRSPHRLLGAAYLASHSMARLIEQHRHQVDPLDFMSFWSSSGELPAAMDLVALPPEDTHEWKDRVLEGLMDQVRTGDFRPSFKELAAIQAWCLAKRAEGPARVQMLASEAGAITQQWTRNGRLRHPYETRRLGLLMFRFGFRGLTYQCSKALGLSPWRNGWQFQSVSSEVHDRIRQRILEIHPQAGLNADGWLRDPALASSSMALPLWLIDGVERVSSLSALFFRATECPWMFPRLQHVFQWHLAIAGRQDVLAEIGQLVPGLCLGLHTGADPG